MRNTAELAKIMRAAGFDLFTDRSSYAGKQAKTNLRGRTHYLDEDTCRYFKSRVTTCHILDSGLLLGIVESVAHPEKGRVYRPVFFDIFGTVVERTRIDSSFKTLEAARKAFWKQANELDVYALTSEAVAQVRDRAVRQIADCDRVLTSKA